MVTTFCHDLRGLFWFDQVDLEYACELNLDIQTALVNVETINITRVIATPIFSEFETSDIVWFVRKTSYWTQSWFGFWVQNCVSLNTSFQYFSFFTWMQHSILISQWFFFYRYTLMFFTVTCKRWKTVRVRFWSAFNFFLWVCRLVFCWH